MWLKKLHRLGLTNLSELEVDKFEKLETAIELSTKSELDLDKGLQNFVDRDDYSIPAQIKIVGIGGGGSNAVDSMIKRGIKKVDFIAINTDLGVLQQSTAKKKIQIGATITRGLGSGANPEIGKKCALEDKKIIEEVLRGSDLVFITAGMGGGTGTGGAPIVASIAKNLGALVIGIVTKPFIWEGKLRMKNAEQGISELRSYVDSLIVIPNSRITSIIDSKTIARVAFDKPNEILYEATRGITDIITINGIINVDFADVRTIMQKSGKTLMGCGIASGKNRAIEAAQKAISSPLLEGVSIKGAKNILLNVSGPANMTMQEIEEGNNIIFGEAGENANVIFGTVIKDEMQDIISYTVIATGFDSEENDKSITGLNVGHKTLALEEQKAIDLSLSTTKVLGQNYTNSQIVPPSKKHKKASDSSKTSLDSKTSLKTTELSSQRKDYYDDSEEDSSAFLRKIMD